MPKGTGSGNRKITRRTMLSVAASIAAAPAMAEGCRIGPSPHHKGPLVFMDYDQLELDASYDQEYYEPLLGQVRKRLASNSEAVRARLGVPQRFAYGPTEIEALDVSLHRPPQRANLRLHARWRLAGRHGQGIRLPC